MTMTGQRMYYVRQDGIVSGPMSLTDLRNSFLHHANSPAACVRRADSDSWLPPQDLPEIADVVDDGEMVTLPASPRAFRAQLEEWTLDD